MAATKPREKIKKRFIEAVEYVSKDKYPQQLQSDIIKALGMAPTNYYGMRSKKGLYPTIDHCNVLCSKYKISAEWLLLGTGSMIKIDLAEMSAAQLIKAALMILKKDQTVNKAVNTTNKKYKNPKGSKN